MINFENIQEKLTQTVNSEEWSKLQYKFNECKNVLLFGHGGNLGVTDHLSTDISRLTNKMCCAPGSGIVATSLITDYSFEKWLIKWVDIMTRGLKLSDTMVIGFSCSVGSKSSEAIINALEHCTKIGIPAFLISARYKPIPKNIQCIITYCDYYHTSEVLSMMLLYQLIHGYTNGNEPPLIKVHGVSEKGSSECDFNALNNSVCNPQFTTPPGKENDVKNIAIDFDGVVHNMDKGWYDGTCYGEPITGSLDAIKELYERGYRIVIFSSKCLSDRPLTNGKGGKELIQEWLEKHDVMHYVSDITHEKIRAKYYIDDKAVLFNHNWNYILEKYF